jgi:hypothetical protein
VIEGTLVRVGQPAVKADDLGKNAGSKQAKAEDFLLELLANGRVPHA